MGRDKPSKIEIFLNIFKVVGILVWIALIVFIFLNKDKVTLQKILNYTPKNDFVAALVIIFLFIVKSLTFVVYSGLLFLASAVIFPFPVAVIVSMIGVLIMSMIPYFIGRAGGLKYSEKLSAKNAKIAKARELRSESDFLFVFIIRLTGLFPTDVVSLYMGATGVNFKQFMWANFCGFIPPILTFTILGVGITDVGSWQFKTAIGLEVVFYATSMILAWHYGKKIKKRKAELDAMEAKRAEAMEELDGESNK